MGKRLILSENEKLYIQSLYKGLLGEQGDSTPEPGTQQPKPNKPRKYLPIAEEFCDILNGKGQLKKGAKGEIVKLFQEALIKCFEPPLQKPLPKYGADSNFGDETKKAVETFQDNNNLKVDGAIGKQTAGKLCELGCIPKEICTKCEGKTNGGTFGGTITSGRTVGGTVEVIRDRVGVDCEKVQSCIDEFLGQVREEICVDEDKIRGLLKCVGIGQCFQQGEVPVRRNINEGCIGPYYGEPRWDLCKVPYTEEKLGPGEMTTMVVGYFYDPKSNSCIARSSGGGPFSQEQKCIECCVSK